MQLRPRLLSYQFIGTVVKVATSVHQKQQTGTVMGFSAEPVRVKLSLPEKHDTCKAAVFNSHEQSVVITT